MRIKPVLVPDHDAAALRGLMDRFAEASTGPTRQQLAESRAAVTAARKTITEGSISDLLNQDPTSPKFNDHPGASRLKKAEGDPKPVTTGHFADKKGQPKPYPALKNTSTGKVRAHPNDPDQGVTEARNTYTVVFVDPSVGPEQIGTFDNAAEAKKLIRDSFNDNHDTGDRLRNVAPGIYVIEADYRNTGEQATADNYKHMYHWIIQKSSGVTEDARQKLNFDEVYGRYLKVTDNDGDPNKEGFSLVTPLNGASWHWRERPEFKKIVQQKLNEPGFLGDHKYQQIIDAMSGKKFDSARHLAKSVTEARNTYTVVFVDPSDTPKQIGTFDNAAEAKQLIKNSYREMYDTGDHLRNVAPGIYVLEEDYRNTGEQATADNYKHMYHWIIQKSSGVAESDPLANRDAYAKQHQQGQVYKTHYPKGENPFHKAGMKDKRSTKMSAYDISNTGPKGVLPESDVAEGMLTHKDFEKPDDVDVQKMAKLAARGLLTYAAKTKMNPANLLKKDYYALAAMLEKTNPQLHAAIDDQLSDNDYNWLYFKAAALAANAAAKPGVAEGHDDDHDDEEGETCPECDGAGCPECYGDEDRDRAYDRARGMERESTDLSEFAPSNSGDGGGDDDGFDEDTLRKLAAQWFAGDEDPQVERLLAAAGWEIGQDEGYDNEPGVFVVLSGDDNGRSYMSWPAEELRSDVAEARPDVMRHKGDQTVRVVKKGGKPIGEIGIDAEASPGNGPYYVKLYDGSYDAVGFDTAAEALAELRYAISEGLAESVDPIEQLRADIRRFAQ